MRNLSRPWRQPAGTHYRARTTAPTAPRAQAPVCPPSRPDRPPPCRGGFPSQRRYRSPDGCARWSGHDAAGGLTAVLRVLFALAVAFTPSARAAEAGIRTPPLTAGSHIDSAARGAGHGLEATGLVADAVGDPRVDPRGGPGRGRLAQRAGAQPSAAAPRLRGLGNQSPRACTADAITLEGGSSDTEGNVLICHDDRFGPVVLPHLRMLPAILRMIVPAVSDQSRAGGTHDREPAARRFTLDRKHAAARGVLRSRVRQSAASRESSWTAGTPPSKPGRKAHNCYRSRGAGGVLPVDAALDAALPTVGHLTMHHQLHPFTRPLPAGSSRGRTGVRGVPRSVT